MAESGFEKVSQASEVAPGEMKSVQLDGEELLLANVDGNYYVISDTCSHRGGPLSSGELTGEQVECPLHGAVFSVVTGDVVSPPASDGVLAREVRISGDDILVGPAKR